MATIIKLVFVFLGKRDLRLYRRDTDRLRQMADRLYAEAMKEHAITEEARESIAGSRKRLEEERRESDQWYADAMKRLTHYRK